MKKETPNEIVPQCFISYSWDSDSHKDWVRELANDLQKNGVSTFLDQWDLFPGADLTSWMESSIRDSHYVLLICTPSFSKKANERTGGVGYEGTIITGELFSKYPPKKKYVPILKEGDSEVSLPSYLRSRLFLDFRDKTNYKKSLEILLRHIYDVPRYKRPPLGKPPYLTTLSGEKKPKKKVIVKERPSGYANNVFLNLPLSAGYRPLFDAHVFTVINCGYLPRTTLEDVKLGTLRINRIFALISSSKYAIHDITPITDKRSKLPGYNIPFELGMFLAIQRSETSTKDRRHSLIFERERYRYQKILSDIAGYDIRSHNDDPKEVIRILRDWFYRITDRKDIPSATSIIKHFKIFKEYLAKICKELRVTEDKITFNEYSHLVMSWLKQK